MSRRKNLMAALVISAVASTTLVACQNARVGARCRTDAYAQDRTHVLVCKNGRWRRLMTKQQAAGLIGALLRARAAEATSPVPAPALPSPTSPPTTPAPPTTTPTTTTTTTTAPPPTVVEVMANNRNVCARVSTDAVKCWGRNNVGQLGDGTTTDRLAPTVIPDFAGAVSVGPGFLATCVVTSGGTVKCVGDNTAGKLGDGTTTNRTTPVTVVGLTDATQVVGGKLNHTCARRSNGTVACWGQGTQGQLGNGASTTSTTPVNVSGILTATQVAVGEFHSCALLSNGTVACWGQNSNGELGNGSTTSSNVPVLVSGLTTAVEIAAGGSHTCARLADGSVVCWGAGALGRLGHGSTASSNVPVPVSGITTATSLGVGYHHSCAGLSNGTVRCWGSNGGGQLGDGTTTPSSSPVTVAGLTGVAAVARGLGDFHTCVRMSTGKVRCWGENSTGQVGDGTTTNRPSPVEVLNLP